MSVNVFYTFPVNTSFVRNDESLLRKSFTVHPHYFKQTKSTLVLCFLKQLIHLIGTLARTDIYVSFFAGYSSFLPSVFSKMTRRPHLIILGGSDCSSFPSIRYGCYQNRILSWFTRKSIRWASHLAPVSQSLVDTPYTYTNTDFNRQGFKVFCKTNVPYTVINLGYDPSKFYKTKDKIPNSFLTVAQLNKPNYYRKGIDLVFKMAEKFPNSLFTIVGNTDEMQYDSIPVNLKLLPFVKYEELRDIYSEHEFYFQLSIMEGFPSAPCEAMLCECIPITSNVGALPEIVGDSGFMLSQKNETDLEALIASAMKADKRSLGENARKRIITMFSPEIRNALIDLIYKLID